MFFDFSTIAALLPIIVAGTGFLYRLIFMRDEYVKKLDSFFPDPRSDLFCFISGGQGSLNFEQAGKYAFLLIPLKLWIFFDTLILGNIQINPEL